MEGVHWDDKRVGQALADHLVDMLVSVSLRCMCLGSSNTLLTLLCAGCEFVLCVDVDARVDGISYDISLVDVDVTINLFALIIVI